MNSFRIITTSCLLFLVLQLPGPGGANPLHPAMPKADLMDIKTLLDNLEDQIPPEDPDMPPQMLAEQNEEAEAERQTWPQEADGIERDRGLVPRDPVSAERAVSLLRTKLQAMLSTPRSTRRSGCFGGRIDRIGSHTGLGCNSFRFQK